MTLKEMIEETGFDDCIMFIKDKRYNHNYKVYTWNYCNDVLIDILSEFMSYEVVKAFTEISTFNLYLEIA